MNFSVSILISSWFDFSRLCERPSCLCSSPILNIHFNNQPSLLEMGIWTFVKHFINLLKKNSFQSFSRNVDLTILLQQNIFFHISLSFFCERIFFADQEVKGRKDNEKCILSGVFWKEKSLLFFKIISRLFKQRCG